MLAARHDDDDNDDCQKHVTILFFMYIIFRYLAIGQKSRVLVNGPGDRGSILG